MRDPWPHLCAELPAVRARFKARPEDFRVEELPAYEPCGSGEHAYLELEKRGLSTHEAVIRVARALGLGPRSIGIAGLKDTQAVTRQWISIQGVDDERVAALDVAGVRILRASRHKNKLRIGHLRGNRFVLRLRDIDPGAGDQVRRILDVLARRGVPNYFGEQRFGARGDTWRIGKALLLGDHAEAVAWIAGRAGPDDSGRVLRARELFDAGDYSGAAETWPGGFRPCIRICRALAKNGGNARRALFALDRDFLRFYTSAYQSWLFNALLARRLPELERVLEGDLAWLHRNGAVFLVKDLALDEPRARAFEISASGPLFGRRMTRPLGVPGALEAEVLAAEGHAEEAFARPGPLQWQGGRRALRFPLHDCRVAEGHDEHGAFVELEFTLPPGCYATCVLREVTRTGEHGEAGTPEVDASEESTS